MDHSPSEPLASTYSSIVEELSNCPTVLLLGTDFVLDQEVVKGVDASSAGADLR
jgi:hypothetical protein